MDSTAHHWTLMALGAAGPGRATVHRFVHEVLGNSVRAWLADAGVHRDCMVQDDTGDGTVVRFSAEVAKARLVAQLPGRVLSELCRYNAAYAEEARVRLQVAFHVGEAGDATTHAFGLLGAPEAKNALEQPGALLSLIVSEAFYRAAELADREFDGFRYHRISLSVKQTKTEAWLRLFGAVADRLAPHPLPPLAVGPEFPALVEALLAVPCVRGAEGRRLLLELFSRREIADVVPYHAEDRLHVIALARTCRRFDGGLADLLDAIKLLDPESPAVTALAALIDGR